MMNLLALLVCVVFTVLAAWHVYMAALPSSGRESASVPSVDGNPLFVPSRMATLAVAGALMLFGILVAATAGLISVGLSSTSLSWLSNALALGLLARSVGDFKYVGFFKRVRGSKFAKLDSVVYSPLCLLLAAGVGWVAVRAES